MHAVLEPAGLELLPLPASNLLCYLFPATAQAFYNTVVESLFPPSAASYRGLLVRASELTPPPMRPLTFLSGDAALAVGFVLFALASK
eukprot:5786585-Prymnesium_polylepis.1